MMTLTSVEIARLRAATLCDLKTIRRWAADPSSVKPASRERLERGAATLGLAREPATTPVRPESIE